MNIAYFPVTALSWHFIGLWWCAACLLLGVWIGWLFWRHTAAEVRQLEMENSKAQQDYEKREKAFASNQELIETIGDSQS